MILYKVFNNAINRNEFDVPLEFEVWGKIVKDSEGNDIQVFVKEDKPRMLRRDSSFYWNGEWETMETDGMAKTIKLKASNGVKIERRHDEKWRLTNMIMTKNDRDTITLKRYFWKNGRLVKTIFDGVERNFIYGKTLKDTVKVVPTDEGIDFHFGYNNTAGKIPSEDELGYEYFVLEPYSGIYTNDNYTSSNSVFLSKQYIIQSNDLLILQKESNRNNPKYQFADEYSDIHVTRYYNPIEEEIPKDWNKFYRYPSDKGIFPKGRAEFYPYFQSECISDGCGSFKIDEKQDIIIKRLEILQSILSYDNKDKEWNRICRTKNEIQATYNHEVQHIFNAKEWMNIYHDIYMDNKIFSSKEQCEKETIDIENRLFMLYIIWRDNEAEHINADSPVPTGAIVGVDCEY